MRWYGVKVTCTTLLEDMLSRTNRVVTASAPLIVPNGARVGVPVDGLKGWRDIFNVKIKVSL